MSMSDDEAPPKQNRKPGKIILLRLGHNLRNLRCQREYTQERLGNLCGFAPSYICNVERARVNITLANLEALAKGLGCTEVDLLR